MSPSITLPPHDVPLIGESPFPLIQDYAFLSDCHTGALVAPDGSIEWMSVPRFDSPSIFGALLDRRAGSFRVGPYGIQVPLSVRYLPGTMILETSWMCPSGWLVVRDCLTIGPWHDGHADESSHTRPPTDHDADHMLVRVVECVQGEVEVEVVCEPIFNYGAEPAQWEALGNAWSCAEASAGEEKLRLMTDLRVGIEGSRARARHTLVEGERRFAALAWSHGLAGPDDLEDAVARIAATEHYWRGWLAGGRFPDHRWRSFLHRSALTLKGLTYGPTGATVAAATTSLPETPGGERNWDYRYCWMRDATFTLWGLHALGFDWEADDFMQFLADLERVEDGGLQIMYGIGGERDLTERTLDHLSGYNGATPVRTGNGAYNQRQNDVYGAVLDSVYLHTKAGGHIPGRLWPVLRAQVECAISCWKQPDQGIWEARGKPQHYVSSKLMCWVALDRGARIAERQGEAQLAEKWQAIADEIREDILTKGVSERGVFRQHYDTDALDASTLLLVINRFLEPTDERIRNTVEAIRTELTEHGFVLRYRTEETDDGLEGAEGTFLICSFWLVSALSEIGDRDHARNLCERLLSHASPLGLYAEELDAATGRHLGNYPQAFTHLALINAVLHVIADEQQLN
ncbi:glycoside hydrolase family 15 protein [Conexibacter sp. DBS9H8]|uniref:glycoside hydrolase family 15 protein n=1 Tax=Conexibacter sp. DBS9H8 TaxID=2937801 RepID=UPI00200F21CE|nr:glycoside hydrolase family 15 protein [Conexibacter sp. DBS9H8]